MSPSSNSLTTIHSTHSTHSTNFSQTASTAAPSCAEPSPQSHTSNPPKRRSPLPTEQNPLPPEARVRWFDTLSLLDLPAVGGKNASLGELTRAAPALGLRVPLGFAIPTAAFRWFLKVSGLSSIITPLLTNLQPTDLENLQRTGTALRKAILQTPLPDELASDIQTAYAQLSQKTGKLAPLSVAVRSSANAEDLPSASFAGAQESFLNISGDAALLEACLHCFASLYTDRALHYRAQHGFHEENVALSIGVQEMVHPAAGASGVLFTLDTETGSRNVCLVNAVAGLGEKLVQGSVSPDEYQVFKPGLKSSPNPILHRRSGSGNDLLLDDATLLLLSRWGCAIEAHYSKLLGTDSPMDIEWAWEGPGTLPAILQARPETVHGPRPHADFERYTLPLPLPAPILRGTSVGTRMASGIVRILSSTAELSSFQKGEILVAEKTDPDWEPVMRLAAGIITEKGGRTCHAAIVSRELGVPALVGTLGATRVLHSGQPVTLNCAAGETGAVYDGLLSFQIERIPSKTDSTRTKIQINLADPAQALHLAQLPSDGAGLVREEFLLAGEIGIHPLALLNFKGLPEEIRSQIQRRTAAFPHKPDYFIHQLSEGIARIAAAFYPRPVLLRLSDLKSNEYASLLGGHLFEPKEENPMLGFRGASRYCHPDFREAFALECAAVLRAREETGLSNIRLMVPFCRTPEEGRAVLEELARNGLSRGNAGLEIWMMCEIPSNVWMAAEFCELFDGFSIGSNDLTQLVLGVDRDSERLSSLFNERHPAVLRAITAFLEVAKARNRPVGICGQAPSDFPDFVRFLIHAGISSISLDPDALIATRAHVLRAEGEMPSLRPGTSV